MAKLAVVIDDWMDENELDASAVQCWTAIEELYGIVPCTVMSMMSDRLVPSACEVDVTGAIGMYALALAAQTPAALLDWNNNYGDDPNKCVLFHCSNLPKSCFADLKMGWQDIIGGTVGNENTFGTCIGRIKTGPFTYCRVSTDDLEGTVRAYLGEGQFTDDPLDTFGGAGVAYIPDLQGLVRYICEMGFEHHVAITHAQVADAITEALDNYMGWDVYQH
jgi:L-fucose isomerase-like protein